MSSIITCILKATVGLLCDKARDSASDRLKDRDLANERLREIIVKDLTDIKSKLDCLSFKDLDASYSFLKEGVDLLNLALDKLNEDQKASQGSADEATRVIIDTASSGILNAALSLPQAIQRLKVSSDTRFVSAQNCFRASREAATHAFNNKSLSIKNRIMACKLRMAARILELGLEDPEAATTASLSSLGELHRLPTIQETFAVFLKGGLKSRIKEAERLETMMSVLFINHALFKFASKYSSKSAYQISWPRIELSGRTFHPILNALEILMKTSSDQELLPQLNREVTDSRISSCVYDFAVNSRGEIILLTDDKITVIYSAGESKDVMFPDPVESKLVEQKGKAVAVDCNDDVYVVRWFKTCDENGYVKEDFVLYIFDENYNIKQASLLDFGDAGKCKRVNIAVDKNQNLIMLTNWNKLVFVCENTGHLKLKFRRDGDSLRSFGISNNNDIMIVSNDRRGVHTYSTEGILKSTIEVPEGHEALQVAFHHGICKIIVLTYVWKQDSWFLLGYCEKGELMNSVFFRIRDPGQFWSEVDMKSHPSGPVAAVLLMDSITFI